MMKTMRKGVSSLALGLVLVGLSWAMQSSAETLTKLKPLSDPALEALLKQQLEPEERVQLQSLIKADLEPGLPGEETAVIWTLLGPSYWSNHLSLLSQQGGHWRLLATLSLEGAEAKLDKVTSDGLLSVTAKIPGPNDPICCPSQQKTLHYRYGRGQLVEVELVPTGAKP